MAEHAGVSRRMHEQERGLRGVANGSQGNVRYGWLCRSICAKCTHFQCKSVHLVQAGER